MRGLQVRKAREMSEVERAWLGAFIEADGSAGWRQMKTMRRPQITIAQKEIEPIATALRITQCGSVNKGKHQCWHWEVMATNDVIAVAEQCAPYSWKIQRMLEEL